MSQTLSKFKTIQQELTKQLAQLTLQEVNLKEQIAQVNCAIVALEMEQNEKKEQETSQAPSTPEHTD